MSLIFNKLPKLKEKLMPLFGFRYVPKGHVNSEWILLQSSKEDMECGLSPGNRSVQQTCFPGLILLLLILEHKHDIGCNEKDGARFFLSF